jgi:hypothetical protein
MSHDVLPIVLPLLAGVPQEVELSEVVERGETPEARQGVDGDKIHGQVELVQAFAAVKVFDLVDVIDSQI